MSESLLPCPFCKCDPVHLWVDEIEEGGWKVICLVCHASGPICADRRLAVEFWNNAPAAMMVCPNRQTCTRDDDGIGEHCEPHIEAEGCSCGSDGCPPCVPYAPAAETGRVAVADSVQADVWKVFPKLGPWCKGCLQQGEGVCMIHSCVRYPPNAHADGRGASPRTVRRDVGPEVTP